MFASGDVRIARAALAEAVGRIELGPGDELADLRQTDIGCDRKDGRAEAPSLYRTVLETNHERTYPMDELKVVNRSLHLLVLLYLLEVDTIIGKQYAQYGGEEPYWQLKQLEQLIISHEIEVELKPTFTKTPTVEQGTAQGTVFFRQLSQQQRSCACNFIPCWTYCRPSGNRVSCWRTCTYLTWQSAAATHCACKRTRPACAS
uniref:Uncharacterized protein n=1 Tax=Anopheles coluzzii TaxID=1518534 RepID=A0A8W7Q2Q5_ANOCL